MKKFVFTLNCMVSLGLLFAFILPYFPSSEYPILSILSLGIPILILVNFLFIIYWSYHLDKRVMLPLIFMLFGWSFSSKFFQYHTAKDISQNPSTISMVSYNVRLFNLYGWKTNDKTDLLMYDFLQQSSPDILVLQEFYDDPDIVISYPYHYKKLKGKNYKIGQIIYSKFPILNAGSLDFPNSNNNAIFADLKIDKDTIRVYNLHLESLRIKVEKEYLESQGKDKLIRRLKNGFSKQEEQAELVLNHAEKGPKKHLFTGDFNNTAYSHTYQILTKNKIDAFVETGSGFGKSFDFPFPVRIDFSLFDESSFKIEKYEQLEALKYSDHYPIQTWFTIP